MSETTGWKMKTEYLLPKKISAENNCENSHIILEEMARQVVLFGEEPHLKVKKGGWIILDFGVELQGGVLITLPNIPPDTHMRLVFGESVSEAMSSIGEKNATNDHAIRDITLPVTCWQSFRYGNTGFRFVKIEAVDNDIEVSTVQAVLEYSDAEYKGEFESNDELLNTIWKTGAYTVHLNMQEYIWDGVKRDRIVWVGDMHPEVSTILSVFGDNPSIKKSLDFISKYTPIHKWINNMPSYNLWWLIIQYDYYMFTGDIEYLRAQSEYIIKMTKHILSYINSDGSHNIENLFVEWNSYQTEYSNAGFQALLTIGLNTMADLCNILDNSELEKQCREMAEATKKHIYLYSGNKQVAAMVSLAEMVSSKEISDNVIKKGHSEGLSSFWGFYTLKALAKSGDMEEALDIIRGYWGKMLEMGATTFWEDFDIKWTENAARIDEVVPEGKVDIHGDFGKFCYKGFRHSLCHGWASGPTAFLSQQVLGVKILKPGCKKVAIKPQLGDLKWAKGKVPTPFGEITVKHTACDGEILTEYTAPEEIEVVVL